MTRKEVLELMKEVLWESTSSPTIPMKLIMDKINEKLRTEETKEENSFHGAAKRSFNEAFSGRDHG